MSTLELSMIVKDGGADLARCLRSAAPFVDRIVVGDTGSRDDSRHIARSLGAEVVDVPWERDFARARNRVLDLRRCEWTLVLDADEMLDPLSGENIRSFLRDRHLHVCHHPRWNYVTTAISRIGHQAAHANPLRLEESREFPAYVPTSDVRLFRSHPALRYSGCVHETVLRSPASRRLPAAKADIVVHHFGFVRDSEETRRGKNDLYHTLGEAKLRIDPDDVQTLIDLGISHLEHHRQPETALGYFKRARDVDPKCALAWLFCGVCFSRLGKAEKALANLQNARVLGLETGVLFQAAGDAHFHKGDFAQARVAYAELDRRGEALPVTEAKRGAAEVHLGYSEAGLRRIEKAVAAEPGAAELYDILAPAALLAGRLPLAVEALQARVRLGNLTDFHERLAAILEARFHASARGPMPSAAMETLPSGGVV
jgi:tetratricopeptide (TPR) repeat protein